MVLVAVLADIICFHLYYKLKVWGRELCLNANTELYCSVNYYKAQTSKWRHHMWDTIMWSRLRELLQLCGCFDSVFWLRPGGGGSCFTLMRCILFMKAESTLSCLSCVIGQLIRRDHNGSLNVVEVAVRIFLTCFVMCSCCVAIRIYLIIKLISSVGFLIYCQEVSTLLDSMSWRPCPSIWQTSGLGLGSPQVSWPSCLLPSVWWVIDLLTSHLTTSHWVCVGSWLVSFCVISFMYFGSCRCRF